MKKIAELVIGNMKIESDMYEKYGSPTLFIAYKDDELAKRYFRRGYYQARCVSCGALFTVRPYSVWHSHQTVTCPACGRAHTGNAIMYSGNSANMLPDNTFMKVIDFKDKVELRIKYTAMYFGRFAYKTFKYLFNIRETYLFDIKNSTCHWKKMQGGKVLEEMEIGYIEDFEKLKEKTALWFYSYDHKINKGNSFTELLKALRTAVNKKIKAVGKTPKPLYIGGRFENRLFGNVLNIAHRVRFWDSENIPALAQGAYDFKEWQNKIILKRYLPKRFEEKIYTATQKSDYVSAVCKVLKIPNIPHTRRNLKFENFAILRECYKIKNYDVAQAIFEYTSKYKRNIEEIGKIINFYNIFINIYPKMSLQNILNKWKIEYNDILRLWQTADKITKQEFYKNIPPISKLHDWLAIAVAKQNDREIIFDVPQEVINRFTVLMKVFGKDFGAKCIEKNSELKFWATSLHNCAAGYKKSIGTKQQLVGISDNRGKPVALLEINSNKITQAKLFHNDPVYFKKDINNTVCEFAAKCGLEIKTNDVIKPGEEKEMPMAGIA